MSLTGRLAFEAAIQNIAEDANRANAIFRSLIEMSDGELLELPNGQVIATIRHENRLLTPRDSEEAKYILEQNCTRQVAPEERVRAALKALLGVSSGIQLLAQRARHDQASTDAVVTNFRARTRGISMPATLKWQRLGQLLTAIHLLRPRSSSSQPMKVASVAAL